MGKASRKKREQTNGCAAGGSNAKGVRLDAAFTGLFHAFENDDVDAAFSWIGRIETISGKSIFDHVFDMHLSTGEVQQGSVIVAATDSHADRCVATLLKVAYKISPNVATDWMFRGMLSMEALPQNDENYKTIVRVMEQIMEPQDMEVALELLKKAESRPKTPRMAELARRLANRFIANHQRCELETATARPMQPYRADATRRL